MWLLENFLEHEVIVTTFLNGFELNLQFLNVRINIFVADGFDRELTIAVNHCNFFIVEIHHILCVLHNWCRIRRNEEFILSYTDYERRTFLRRN
jgi:hypothetical protein